MNEKLEELKRVINEHFDNEMELIKRFRSLSGLSSDEYKELEDVIYSHPHARSFLLLSSGDVDEMKEKVLKRQEEVVEKE